MSWNYRVFHEIEYIKRDIVEHTYTIREVFYKDETGAVDGYSNAIYPSGETPEELAQDLELMLGALKKLVLTIDVFGNLAEEVKEEQ